MDGMLGSKNLDTEAITTANVGLYVKNILALYAAFPYDNAFN
jgi:hypothetical protein